MSPEDHPTVRSLSITQGTKENQHGQFAHLDNSFLDCAADCDVRWLLAAATAQSWRRAYAVSGRLFPGRARARRSPAVVVAALLYVSGPNGPSRFGQAGACVGLFVGILAQSGGFFLHMLIGKPNRESIWTKVTIAGAALLACAVIVLIYGLITSGGAETV